MRQRGDTIVEVLLATVIISAVIAAAYSLTNRATRFNQTSVERTKVANLMREQVELVRGARTAAGGGSSSVWDDIMDAASAGSPVYKDDAPCDPTTGTTTFYISTANTFESYDKGNPFQDAHSSDIFAIWLEAYLGPSDDYIDVHARACWEGIGGEATQRSAIVLRLAV